MVSKRNRSSAGMRIIVIAVISFVLFVPSLMIQSLIREREMTRNKAVTEVNEKWGGSQMLAGPVLTVPLRKLIKDEKGKVTSTCMRYAHFLPDELSIRGTVTPHVRHRGIYNIALYNGKLQVTGTFSLPELETGVEGEDIMWNDSFLGIGVTDMKGIKETIRIVWNNKSLTANPGIASTDVLPSGVSAQVDLDRSVIRYPFSFVIDLNGSQELRFLPMGKETRVALSSPWTAPSFQGGFLPEKMGVSKNGFTAEWHVLQLNRNYPQKWVGKEHNVFASAFGVNLFTPVDEYQKTSRSLKYSLLFIGLTFASYFIIEILNKKYMHPIHYLLIGLALVLFYTLLLSLSEHIGFNYSYLIAAVGTILLITAYTKSVLSSWFMASVVFSILSVLYSFLYVLLQVEDYALLLGSLGLFAILGLFMYLTRKIDWYSAMKSDEADDHA